MAARARTSRSMPWRGWPIAMWRFGWDLSGRYSRRRGPRRWWGALGAAAAGAGWTRRGGASAAALVARARACGVEDRVHLTGVSDRIGEVLAGSDILLSCARNEPLGLALMEAMARETPVVATRVGGVPDIVRDGQTGLLVA